MNSTIKKIGNSKGVIIPASILKALGLRETDILDLTIENNKIVISKQETFNPESLEKLFINFEGTHKSEIIFDDKPKGREAW